MKRLLLLISAFLISWQLPAQEAGHVTIKGAVVGDQKPTGKVILYSYADYLTETLYDRVAVPIQGDSFRIVLRYQETTEPFILGYLNRTMQLIVEPGGEYEVWLSQNGFALASEPAGKLNEKIRDYHNYMADFMAKANTYSLEGHEFDDFKTSTFMKYYSEKNDFFNAYYKYDMKIKELFFGATGQYYIDKALFDKTERNYLTETKIRLSHPKWGEYFRNHVVYRSRFCKYQRIACCDPQAACQATAPFQEAEMFKNDTLRELAKVVLIAQQIEANKGGQHLEKLQLMQEKLDSMANKSSVEYARTVAKQFQEKFNLFGIGSKMPYISLANADGNLVNVNELKGKYILLDFWALWCKPCIKEMAFYHEMKDKLSDKLTVVSISVDEDQAGVWSYVQEKGYQWLFLHNGEDRKLLNKLMISAYPSYFLFDPDGKLVYKPSSISEEWEKLKEMVSK